MAENVYVHIISLSVYLPFASCGRSLFAPRTATHQKCFMKVQISDIMPQKRRLALAIHTIHGIVSSPMPPLSTPTQWHLILQCRSMKIRNAVFLLILGAVKTSQKVQKWYICSVEDSKRWSGPEAPYWPLQVFSNFSVHVFSELSGIPRRIAKKQNKTWTVHYMNLR